MMRWILNSLYANFLALAAPYWLTRVPRARRYRAGLLQRLGLAPRLGAGPRLWVHCASVGEASIPRKLVERFRQRHPHWDIVFSTFTDTGADRLRELYPDCTVFYWPLDLSPCTDAALRRVRPDAVLLVELEAWPNFMLGCRARGIPVAIVSGRINPASVRTLRGLSRLCGRIWDAVSLCCARSASDAERFEQAGMPRERIVETGSLKYDVLTLEIDPARQAELRALFALAQDAPVIVAGSTHPGEDAVLCRVRERLAERHPGVRLILVPRHIERAAAVARELGAAGVPVARKTELESGAAADGTEVILVDTIGDLTACYALATVAFVGRSLLPPGGGQNMMEPAALGKPVAVGPWNGNFEPEMELLRARNAVCVVEGEDALAKELDRLLSDPEAAGRLGERAREAVLESRGAAERTLEEIQAVLAERGLL